MPRPILRRRKQSLTNPRPVWPAPARKIANRSSWVTAKCCGCAAHVERKRWSDRVFPARPGLRTPCYGCRHHHGARRASCHSDRSPTSSPRWGNQSYIRSLAIMLDEASLGDVAARHGILRAGGSLAVRCVLPVSCVRGVAASFTTWSGAALSGRRLGPARCWPAFWGHATSAYASRGGTVRPIAWERFEPAGPRLPTAPVPGASYLRARVSKVVTVTLGEHWPQQSQSDVGASLPALAR
jgi:hypothetical protein